MKTGGVVQRRQRKDFSWFVWLREGGVFNLNEVSGVGDLEKEISPEEKEPRNRNRPGYRRYKKARNIFVEKEGRGT